MVPGEDPGLKGPLLWASVYRVPARNRGFVLTEVMRLLLILNSSSKPWMLQWEQHQDLSETCVSFLFAVVVERSRLSLEVNYFKSSDGEGGDGRFVHLQINRTAPM